MYIFHFFGSCKSILTPDFGIMSLAHKTERKNRKMGPRYMLKDISENALALEGRLESLSSIFRRLVHKILYPPVVVTVNCQCGCPIIGFIHLADLTLHIRRQSYLKPWLDPSHSPRLICLHQAERKESKAFKFRGQK
jgi:hypothetical protein